MTRRAFIAASAAAWVGPVFARTSEQEVPDNEIVIGQTAALTGPLSKLTKVLRSGAQLAFDESNRQGGIWGRKLQLISLDDQGNPEKAVNNCRTLIETRRAFAFFGCTGSATTTATAAVLRESGAALFSPYAVLDSARLKTEGTAYYTRATLAREAESLVQHLVTIGMTRIALAHIDQPSNGNEVFTLFDQAFTRHQVKAQAVGSIKLDGSNIAVVARTLLEGNPQAVILAVGGPLGPELIQAILTSGGQPSFYGLSTVPGDTAAGVLGNKNRTLALVQVTPSPWGGADPLVRRYRNLAIEANVPVGYLSLEGFLGAEVMMEAIRRCGRELSRARLQTTLRSFKAHIGGMDIDFSSGQFNGSRFVELVHVSHDGRFSR